ncbi:transposase [Candidatus Paracaedibacter acanthamoebae]|uniref:Transposase n=1 Tax=Candidatus Odyssella acanthamoebae TaxID=91604 RepID=A0A077AW48_9PROT|nr:transposase [Candidatus Paracaedibacter acanthamoebae]
MKKRFNEAQIIGVPKGQEAGIKVAEICRRHRMSEATFYNWKAKYGALEVSEAKRLKSLEEENRRLKQLVVDLSLDKIMLQDALSKKL